jgi:hypothetical protein
MAPDASSNRRNPLSPPENLAEFSAAESFLRSLHELGRKLTLFDH